MPLSESMISTLKSNKNIMLDKSKRFRKTLGGYNKCTRGNFNFPKASPELLLEIKNKVRRENRKLWMKVVVTSVMVISILIWLFF
ncbi:MAG: hypothetical protein Wins2KO_28830 [Winogradskyella sp.]|uniref:hypothetical protein n=1 Tax=Winogradskyella sp. TaxID=1883156 RepID=UPI0025F897EE|nr:hypothetical protein [Winogradskyella sp.]NRB60070.1 hypothetical protein [Winogradskyella sp.]